MTDKRCATCRYWHERRDGLGRCSAILTKAEASESVQAFAESAGQPESFCWVRTAPMFGCVLWEEKK